MLSGNHDLVIMAISSKVLPVTELRQNARSGRCVRPASQTNTSTTRAPRNIPNNPPIALSAQSEPMAFSILVISLAITPNTINVATNTSAYAVAMRTSSCSIGNIGAKLSPVSLLKTIAIGQPTNDSTSEISPRQKPNSIDNNNIPITA